MEDLAAFTALNHSGCFEKNFVKFQKYKYVIYRLRVGPYGESRDLGLENAALGLRPLTIFSRPRSQFFTIRTSQPAYNIYLFPIFISQPHGLKMSHASITSPLFLKQLSFLITKSCCNNYLTFQTIVAIIIKT